MTPHEAIEYVRAELLREHGYVSREDDRCLSTLESWIRRGEHWKTVADQACTERDTWKARAEELAEVTRQRDSSDAYAEITKWVDTLRPVVIQRDELLREVDALTKQRDEALRSIERLENAITAREQRSEAALAKRDSEWSAAYCGGNPILGPQNPEELRVFLAEAKKFDAEQRAFESRHSKPPITREALLEGLRETIAFYGADAYEKWGSLAEDLADRVLELLPCERPRERPDVEDREKCPACGRVIARDGDGWSNEACRSALAFKNGSYAHNPAAFECCGIAMGNALSRIKELEERLAHRPDVDSVAKAIYAAFIGGDATFQMLSDIQREHWRREARAAIEVCCGPEVVGRYGKIYPKPADGNTERVQDSPGDSQAHGTTPSAQAGAGRPGSDEQTSAEDSCRGVRVDHAVSRSSTSARPASVIPSAPSNVRCNGPYGNHARAADPQPCGWEGTRDELRNGCCPICGAGHIAASAPSEDSLAAARERIAEYHGVTPSKRPSFEELWKIFGFAQRATSNEPWHDGCRSGLRAVLAAIQPIELPDDATLGRIALQARDETSNALAWPEYHRRVGAAIRAGLGLPVEPLR